MMDLKLNRDVGILHIEGDIVFENSNPAKEEAKDKLRQAEVDKLVLDMSDVSYLDSSGIGFVITLFKFIREKNGELVLTNMNEKVKRVCELTKLGEIIDIYDSNDEAIEELIN